ncbi:hypothetical protein GCM10011351_11650 [Paraliobacillus quinghaiensis]|uniref:Uncharacterized protein n=1 Tax=Paraliobacillus quinghaiensis TaxID=470815 RepID=A0A917WSD7_9BACI|nr:hypothetical protein [Paraliobacillus quinghaiensis]GGM27448.1 hypothetical protein GCM10011351_11650 [Paraliobacillus quinghaiensis]
MAEANDNEAFHGQSAEEREKALELLSHFVNDEKDYYVIYKKTNQRVKRELKFNQVKELKNNKFAIAMHHEDVHDSVCYYSGEEVILDHNEIYDVHVIDPEEYDFVVYTD